MRMIMKTGKMMGWSGMLMKMESVYFLRFKMTFYFIIILRVLREGRVTTPFFVQPQMTSKFTNISSDNASLRPALFKFFFKEL